MSLTSPCVTAEVHAVDRVSELLRECSRDEPTYGQDVMQRQRTHRRQMRVTGAPKLPFGTLIRAFACQCRSEARAAHFRHVEVVGSSPITSTDSLSGLVHLVSGRIACPIVTRPWVSHSNPTPLPLFVSPSLRGHSVARGLVAVMALDRDMDRVCATFRRDSLGG